MEQHGDSVLRAPWRGWTRRIHRTGLRCHVPATPPIYAVLGIPSPHHHPHCLPCIAARKREKRSEGAAVCFTESEAPEAAATVAMSARRRNMKIFCSVSVLQSGRLLFVVLLQ